MKENLVKFVRPLLCGILFIIPITACAEEMMTPPPSNRPFLDYEVFPLDSAVWWESFTVIPDWPNSFEGITSPNRKIEIERVGDNVGELFTTVYEEDGVTIRAERKSSGFIFVHGKKVIFSRTNSILAEDAFLLYDFGLIEGAGFIPHPINKEVPSWWQNISDRNDWDSVPDWYKYFPNITTIEIMGETLKYYSFSVDTWIEKIGSSKRLLSSIEWGYAIDPEPSDRLQKFYYKNRLVWQRGG